MTLPSGEVTHISFQNGPIAESGVNGLTQEVLIAICCDRLRGFQSGQFACRENALALTKLEEAQHWLHRHATKNRTDNMARFVLITTDTNCPAYAVAGTAASGMRPTVTDTPADATVFDHRDNPRIKAAFYSAVMGVEFRAKLLAA